MVAPHKYVKKTTQFVIAVRLALDVKIIAYKKWGGIQRAKPGDWLVDNDGDVYTIDQRVFARTYRRLRPGIYLKTTPVWATVAETPGIVKTKEGASRYKKGDFLVSNRKSGADAYCVSRKKFLAMYRRVE
jgi:hypothetical protein